MAKEPHLYGGKRVYPDQADGESNHVYVERMEALTSLHPNTEAVGHLYAAKAEFSALAVEEAGRRYAILLTDLEKLIHVEAGYFPRE